MRFSPLAAPQKDLRTDEKIVRTAREQRRLVVTFVTSDGLLMVF
jgi:hypothetical protein